MYDELVTTIVQVNLLNPAWLKLQHWPTWFFDY